MFQYDPNSTSLPLIEESTFMNDIEMMEMNNYHPSMRMMMMYQPSNPHHSDSSFDEELDKELINDMNSHPRSSQLNGTSLMRNLNSN